MLKGVNRCIIEVKNTGSPFFERVICFVRPEFCSEGFPKLHKTAERYVNELEEKAEIKKKTFFDYAKLFGLPLIFAALGFTIGILLR